MFSPSLLYSVYMRVLFGTLAHFVHFCLALLLKFFLRSFLCLAGVIVEEHRNDCKQKSDCRNNCYQGDKQFLRFNRLLEENLSAGNINK